MKRRGLAASIAVAIGISIAIGAGLLQPGPLFMFAPASADGLPTTSATKLCDVASDAGMLTGATALCLNGSGTSWDGGLALTGTNVSTQTRSLCPNGPNCTDVARQRLTKASPSYYETASQSGPTTSSMSFCVWGQWDGFATEQLSGKWHDGNTPTLTFAVDILTSGVAKFYAGDGSSTSTVSVGPMTARVPHLICAAYGYVGSGGVNRMEAWMDGTASGSALTNAVGPLLAQSRPIIIGASSNHATTFAMNAGILGFLWTESELSTAQVQALARAVLADTITGSKGEAITADRTSAVTCENNDSSETTTLRTGRMCIRRGGIEDWPAYTQLLLRTDALDNAAWSDVGTPAVSGGSIDAWTIRDGSPSGEILTDNDAAAQEGRSQAVTTATQSSYTFSCVMQSGTATEATLSMVGTGNSAGDTSCTFTGLTSTSSRKACTTTAAYGAGLSAITVSVLVGDAVGDTGTLKVSECNLTATDRAYPYAFAAGSTASISQTSISATKPSGWVDSAGCWGATVEVAGVTAGARVLSTAAGSLYLNSTTAGIIYDGTNTVTATAGSSILSRAVRLYGGWGPSMSATHDGVLASGSYDNSITGSTVYIGSTSGTSNHLGGVISKVTLDKFTGRCQ